MKSATIRSSISTWILLGAVFTLSLVFCAFERVISQEISKQKLRVLYVGGAANWENEAFNNPTEKDLDVARRMRSFEEMLQNYFSEVQVIHASEYQAERSSGFDVTIMDGVPPPLTKAQIIKDENGRTTKVIPAAYLEEEFNEPVLFVGSIGETMGRSIGLKLDWYCLCLDAHAHSYRKDHAIFQGPFPVNISEEVRPTPEEAFAYEYFSEEPYPDSLPMWRVQTKGYVTDRHFKIGMVARPWGFEDSPDAEYISSGVCQKTLDAVALGRHGNFFHWGFAASPEFMTEEANRVFANAVAYIAGFKGKGVIARKYLDRRATKEYIKERKYLATQKAWKDRLELNEKFDRQMLQEKQEAEAKKAKGETLTQREQMSLNYRPQPKLLYEDLLKRYQGDLFKRFGTNEQAYLRYYNMHYPYFYSHDASYVISVDEEVRSLHIPNTEIRLLDTCIRLWEEGRDTVKAKMILHRYTLLDFPTAAQWRAWFESRKDKLFFTQSGGWYFMVDTLDPEEPANRYPSSKKNQTKPQALVPAATSPDSPVQMASGLRDLGDGTNEITVRIHIHPGYHVYAFVAEGDPYEVMELAFELPPGFEQVGELQKPSFIYFNERGTTAYEQELVFRQLIRGQGDGQIRVSLSYQCCDSHQCFPPAKTVQSLSTGGQSMAGSNLINQ